MPLLNLLLRAAIRNLLSKCISAQSPYDNNLANISYQDTNFQQQFAAFDTRVFSRASGVLRRPTGSFVGATLTRSLRSGFARQNLIGFVGPAGCRVLPAVVGTTPAGCRVLPAVVGTTPAGCRV
ncbi:MAG: hypothetical protein U1A16_04065, partial [Patescibacteria group bacterium]|nr:hypothetical protein [Patescibacteria group bacterium]